MTPVQMFFIFFLCAFAHVSFALETSDPSTLKSIKSFSTLDQRALKHRYREDFKKNDRLFTDEQYAIIRKNHLEPIIAQIILSKQVTIKDADTLLAFSQKVADSAIDYSRLKPRIVRYMHHKALLFDALEKAVARERYHEWKVEEIKIVREDNDSFVQTITSYQHLHKDEQEKLINAYAICIRPFIFEDYRTDEDIVRPRICDPAPDYTKPRHDKHATSARATFSHGSSDKKAAYQYFLDEAKRVTNAYNLDTFEQVKMAKCISEQSLRYFAASRHPIKALHKYGAMKTKSQDKSFYMHSAVCVNFSALAYNILRHINPNLEIYLVKNGLHVYLEFEVAGVWYHTHPFNRGERCDVNRFDELSKKNGEVQEESSEES